MKKRTVLVFSLAFGVLLAISIFLPIYQLPEAKSINAAAFESFYVLSDEAKFENFRQEQPRRQSEIYRGLLENQASQMSLTSAQKQWIKEAVAFHDETFFSFMQKNAPVKNNDEFRKNEIIKSYELLQSKRNSLFTAEESRKLCMDATIADMSAKHKAIKAASNLEEEAGSCTCLDNSWCTGCSSGWACSEGGCTGGGWGCGCTWTYACNKTCKQNPPNPD